jgi:hypothetical protein
LWSPYIYTTTLGGGLYNILGIALYIRGHVFFVPWNVA